MIGRGLVLGAFRHSGYAASMTLSSNSAGANEKTRPFLSSDIIDAFRLQARYCEGLGSPFTSQLLSTLADDLENGGVSSKIVMGFSEEPVAAALALRLAGGLSTLVITGQAPDLESYYPPSRRRLKSKGFIRTLTAAIEEHQIFLKAFIDLPVQTNEVGRSACLLGGFLEIARQTEGVLHLYEIGASAGLNLAWDQYRYTLAGATWGPDHGIVHLTPDWQGQLPPLHAVAQVASRQGCDIRPIDLYDPGFQRQAEAYIWPDQFDRLARFRAAADTVRRLGISVDKADAADWLTQQLAKHQAKGVRIVFHSIMWQYLSRAAQEDITRQLNDAGAKATTNAPLAWLRLEPEDVKGPPSLMLTLWPGGQTQKLAVCHPHGKSVMWSPEGG